MKPRPTWCRLVLPTTLILLLLLLLVVPCSAADNNTNETTTSVALGFHNETTNATNSSDYINYQDYNYNSPEYEHEHEHEHEQDSESPYYFAEPQHALVYPWVVQILGVITFFALQQLELPIPFAAVMFVIGMAMGIAAFRLDSPLPQFHNSIRMWSDMDSQLLLLVFLPGLIFRDAIDIDIWTFQKCFSQLLVLAFPMVLVGTVLTALVVVYVLPSATASSYYDEFTWSLGLTVGSILASTDPVAVAAVLKQADAPPRLQMHIGGESMLNDGAAVVLYLIFSTQFLAELGLNDTEISVGHGILTFVRMSLGGVAVGFCFAMGLLLLLYELDRRLEKENGVLQVVAAVSTAYLSYYVSEQVCQMSGVISCVTCGVLTKAFGGSRLLADPELMDTYLKLLEHLLNTLLFTLGGTVFGEVIANSDQRAHFTWTEWTSLLILYTFVMLIRGLQVTLFYPVLQRLGLSTNWKEMAFLGFAGLRGAVGIALALALDRTVRQDTYDERSRAVTSTVVGLAGGVSFMTLLINGTLAEWLLRKLGLTPPKASRKQVLRLFEISARDFILHAFEKLRKRQPRFEHVPFQMVQSHLPFLASVDQEYRDNLEDEIQSGMRQNYLHRRNHSFFQAYQEMEDSAAQAMSATVNDSLNAKNAKLPACPEESKQEVRTIFLKLLNTAYQAELAHGGCRDDNGFTFETLQQSVVFAARNCAAGEAPLQDWTYCDNFASHTIQGEQYIRRFGRWCQDKLDSKLGRSQGRCSYSFQQLRNRVVRALVFLEAHRIAEEELRGYLKGADLQQLSEGMAAAHLEDAIVAVLEESKAQVQLAEKWLETGVCRGDRDIIRGHYMVSMLLHKVELYVERSVRSGRLKETEGRLYLEEIKTRVEKVLNCQSKHERESSGRQKRQKQKSSESTSIGTSLGSFWNGTAGPTERGKTRRKRQQSAPTDSRFWAGADDTGDGKAGSPGDGSGRNRRSLSRQWSIKSNASVPDPGRHEVDASQQMDGDDNASNASASNAIASLFSAMDSQKDAGSDRKSRRKKQLSAPVKSTFWKVEEGGLDNLTGQP